MRAEIDEPACIKHCDLVSELKRGAPVGDQQRGPAGHHAPQRLVYLGLHPGVHRRGGVIEDEDPGVGDQGPRECDPLPLAAGQGQALLADHRVVAVGQAEYEFLGLGGPGGRDDLHLRRVWPAVGDVRPKSVGEEEAVLHDQADRRPQRVEREVANVVPADPHRAAVDVIEARQQQRDGRLARS